MSPLDQVCTGYLEGQRLRDEIRKLSQKRLAKRFALAPVTVSQIANCQPSRAKPEVQAEIRKLISRRDRMKSQAAELTLAKLCSKHGVDQRVAIAELERLDAWRAAS